MGFDPVDIWLRKDAPACLSYLKLPERSTVSLASDQVHFSNKTSINADKRQQLYIREKKREGKGKIAYFAMLGKSSSV